MEILSLVLLYYLSQNPDFSDSVKPLMEKLKNSEQMLCFLKDLSKFSETFSSFAQTQPRTQESGQEKKQNDQTPKTEQEDKKDPQSPTAGIADEFIQNILDSYLKKR